MASCAHWCRSGCCASNDSGSCRHDALGTHWQSDPQFSLDAHVRSLKLPPRAGQAQLEAAASKLASTQLDPHRPLWQIHLVEHYRKGSAVIARFHHCYADGIALMRVLLSLTDPAPEAACRRSPGASRVIAGNPQPGLLSLLAPLTNLAGSAISVMQRAARAPPI